MADDRKKALKAFPEKCRSCDTCMLACSMVHEGGKSALDKARLSIVGEIADHHVLMTICRHCKDPKCMRDCPFDAMSCDESGIVVIDEQKCKACGNCQKNCPFGAVVYFKDKKIYQKCDLCRGRSEGPVCVEVCPVAAIVLENRIKK